jgi:hypothetical protein
MDLRVVGQVEMVAPHLSMRSGMSVEMDIEEDPTGLGVASESKSVARE